MTRDPLATINVHATPQTQPIPGRTDQVRNNAGGYVFAKDLWTKLEDFLILGTTGGTYYVGEDKLTEQNAAVIFDAIREDGPRVVALLTGISTARPPRAPKNRPALFALAAASAYGDPATVQAVKAALPKVARTTDHLATFFGYRKQLGGKVTSRGTAPRTGRALRTALGSWFLGGDVNAVAWKAAKARQRKTPAGENLALRDILRIAHPKADTPARQAMLGWIAGTVNDAAARELVPAIDDFLTAQAAASTTEAIRVAVDRKVPWEFLPSDLLAEPEVWAALAPHLGMTALLRNLARMTRIGTLAPGAEVTSLVASRLADTRALAAGRIHPMDVFLALRVYNSGHSQPHRRAEAQTWAPVAEISDALEEAYEHSFAAATPTGKRLLVAVDSSGSMTMPLTLGGSPLGRAYEVGCAMAAMLKRIEGPAVQVLDVDTKVHHSKITARTNLREIASWMPSGGGTDLSLPFGYAVKERLKVDGFVLFTDGETWAGREHPMQQLAAYRAKRNPAAQVVVASMAAVGHTIREPGDDGVLNLAGLDASLPQVIAGFIR